MWLAVGGTIVKTERLMHLGVHQLNDCLVSTFPNAAPLRHQSWKVFYEGIPELSVTQKRHVNQRSLKSRSKVELIALGSPHDWSGVSTYKTSCSAIAN